MGISMEDFVMAKAAVLLLLIALSKTFINIYNYHSFYVKLS